jgi:hypothetical protein
MVRSHRLVLTSLLVLVAVNRQPLNFTFIIWKTVLFLLKLVGVGRSQTDFASHSLTVSIQPHLL